MKKITKLVVLLALTAALLLAQAGQAEASDAVKGIYDALVAEGSEYSQMKALYTEYFPGVTFTEALEGDGITLAASGSEDMNGSWTFTREGDALTATFGGDDFSGLSMAIYMVGAVGEYFDMNTDVIHGYINGLSALDIESDNFAVDTDEATGDTTVRIGIAGPWDMKELDQMVIDPDMLGIDPLGEDNTSTGSSIGKVMAIVNGNAEGATMLVGEYGELDDLAYRSIINLVSAMKPNGYEAFIADFTELADVQADGYTVTLNVDEAAVAEIIDDGKASYSYAIIRFGE